jgi:tetratricopeptide (TPR) repeat protein
VTAASPLVSHGRRSGLSAEVARLLDQAGAHLDRRDAKAAAPMIAGALALAPDHPEVLRLAAVAAVLEGRPADAIAALRHALASRPDDALLHNNLGSALAKALEDQDRYADAHRVLEAANALRREQQPWDRAKFGEEVDAILAAFGGPAPAPRDDFGREAIFIVSLPRSGSTLVEQIVAAHPGVEGAGELPDLSIVIDEESRRRGQRFPAWAAAADAADWRRLGERYLERTARWRRRRPRFTDKSLLNVPYVGAAAAMLPGARFVHCRRDPVETALSCYRQWFAQGQAWSYAIDDIAAFRRGHERLMALWEARLPHALHTVVHETLVAEPETSVRGLLHFLGLTFDPACLAFHRSERSVRTASAAQVRQPLRRDTGRADRYGALLDPLRRALASP